MIINSLPYKTVGTSILLPSYTRAPVGLASGTAGFIVPSEQNGGNWQRDFLVTSFSPEHWADLWRVEIHLKDKAGELSELIEIFDKLGIIVLASESRKTVDPTWSVKHYMVSRLEPSDWSEDAGNADHLTRLEDYLFAHFAKSLKYSPGGIARVSVERNWPHHTLSQIVPNVDEAETITIRKGGWFSLPDNVIDDPNLWLKERRIYVSVNTRSKLLYISTRREKSGFNKLSIVIYFKESDRVMGKIYKAIGEDLKFNVVRHQFRGGAIGLSSDQREEKFGNDKVVTLNLMIDDGRDGDAASREEVIETIDKRLKAYLEDSPFVVEQPKIKEFIETDYEAGDSDY